jgi:hypothetical protein
MYRKDENWPSGHSELVPKDAEGMVEGNPSGLTSSFFPEGEKESSKFRVPRSEFRKDENWPSGHSELVPKDAEGMVEGNPSGLTSSFK